MTPRSTVTMLALATALVVCLSGCVPEPSATDPSGAPTSSVPVTPGATPSGSGAPSASATASPTPTATATPTPTASASPPAPGRAVLPACPELLPLSTVHALFGDAAEPLEVGGSAADHMPGPLAARTVRDARQSELCTWVIPFSDGGFNVVAAEITGSARDRLISALRSSAGYSERTLSGSVSFSSESETDAGTSTVVYVFSGNVWITVNGTLSLRTAREFAGSALDAVRAANA